VVPRERCAAGRSAFPPLGRRVDQLHAGERRGHRFLVHWAHRRARGASGGRHVGWDAASPSRPDRCGRAGALSGFAGRARLNAERSGGRQEPAPPARGAWMRTRRKDSVSWRRLVAPVTVRLLADRLSVGPRPARDRCQRSRTGEAAGRRLGTGPPRPSAPRRTTARERRLVDSCPANRRRTVTEQYARHECVFRSGCCPSGAGLAGRATIRPHLRTQHEGSESGQAGSRRRHNASGRDGRSSRRVNRRDGDWLTGRRARAARSGAVGTLDGRTASGRAGRGGTVPEIQSSALCWSCATFGPGRGGDPRRSRSLPRSVSGEWRDHADTSAHWQGEAQRIGCTDWFIAAEPFPGTGCAGWLGRGARADSAARQGSVPLVLGRAEPASPARSDGGGRSQRPRPGGSERGEGTE